MNYQILRKRSCINLGVLAVHNDAFYFSQLKGQMLNIVMNLKSYSCCLKLPTFHSVIPHGRLTTGIFEKGKNTYFIDLNIFILFHFLFVIPESGKRVHFFFVLFFWDFFFFFLLFSLFSFFSYNILLLS